MNETTEAPARERTTGSPDAADDAPHGTGPAAPRGLGDRLRPAAALARNVVPYMRVGAIAARAHGAGRIASIRRMQRLRAQGYLFDEALRDGMLDPAIPDSALPGYAPRHQALIAQARVNSGAFEATTTEKAVFYRHCQALGLPTPELFAVVTRSAAGWGRGDRVLDGPHAFARLLADLPRDLVVKPSGGGKGVGVRVLRRDGEGFTDLADGRHISVAELWRAITEHPDYEAHVVQERLRNNDALTRAVPSEALHTIRLVTFVPRSGPVEISQSVIRLGIGGGVTDNFGDGSDGNGYAEIDPATGLMGPLRMARPDGYGFLEHACVPSTGTPIEGVAVPLWAEACDLAFEAARRFLPTRSIGWDIAIADRGPVLVEANRFWTPFPRPDLAQVIARIDAG